MSGLMRQAVLATVISGQGPMTGYRIDEELRDRFGPGTLAGSRSRVYGEIDGLTRNGELERIARGERQVVRPTSRGVEAWREWLTSEFDLSGGVGGRLAEVRREVRVRLCAARTGDHATMLRIVERYEEALRSVYALTSVPPRAAETVREMMRDLGDREMQAELSWCQDSRERLSAERGDERRR